MIRETASVTSRELFVREDRYLQVSPKPGVQRQVCWAGPPDYCPLCNRGCEPARVSEVLQGDGDGARLEVFLQCPFRDCRRSFIGTYAPHPIPMQTGGAGLLFSLESLAPRNPPLQEFGQQIAALSLEFVEIYNQALVAQLAGLDQICGPGYRKALEFLIKAFLISRNVAPEETVRKTLLQPCIQKWVDDPRVKLCAERAVWIGNDETHYERRWVDQDVSDLKTLIRLTCHWIDGVLVTDHYVGAMQQTP